MEPAALDIDTHLGDFFDFSSKCLTAWKRIRGPAALTLKAVVTSFTSTVAIGVRTGQDRRLHWQ